MPGAMPSAAWTNADSPTPLASSPTAESPVYKEAITFARKALRQFIADEPRLQPDAQLSLHREALDIAHKGLRQFAYASDPHAPGGAQAPATPLTPVEKEQIGVHRQAIDLARRALAPYAYGDEGGGKKQLELARDARAASILAARAAIAGLKLRIDEAGGKVSSDVREEYQALQAELRVLQARKV